MRTRCDTHRPIPLTDDQVDQLLAGIVPDPLPDPWVLDMEVRWVMSRER